MFFKIFLVVVAVWTLGFFFGHWYSEQKMYLMYGEPEAVCGTDTECMAHCPPPADDPDCDGGPQT
jgi:hypothetical protein